MKPSQPLLVKTLTTPTLTTASFQSCLSKRKGKFHDSFLREVRVSYQPIGEAAFKMSDPETVAAFVRRVMSDNSREHFIALFLDGAHQVASFSVVSIGTANTTPVHPRELFQRAIGAGAVAIIIAHNHPSAQLEPSREDYQITRQLKEAGVILGIKLLDHVIVTDTEHLSFQERGLL